MALNKEFMHWHIPYGVVYFRKIKYYSTSNRYPQGSFNEYQMTITTKDVLYHHLGLYMLWQKNAPLMKPDTVFWGKANEIRFNYLSLNQTCCVLEVLCGKLLFHLFKCNILQSPNCISFPFFVFVCTNHLTIASMSNPRML